MPLFHKLQFLAPALSLTLALLAHAEDWPQWRGPNRDGVWTEKNVVEKFDKKRLEPVWRAKIASGYSGPTVVGGLVYVTDRVVEPTQIERVHCFDAKTGDKVWSHEYEAPYSIGYEAGPRASVTIDEGRAYALGAMGHLHVFDAKTGEVLWQKDCDKEYRISASKRMPIWGIAGAPLIYKDTVILHIAGDDGACIVALDKKTGEEKWRALDDRAQYSAPVIIKQAGRDVVVVWTGDSLAGLDAATGKVYWREVMTPRNMPIGISTPVLHDDKLFVTSFYDGSLLVQLNDDKPTVKRLYHRVGESEQQTDALQSIIATPLIKGDFIYGVDSYGELRCLELATGDRVWESLAATPKARWSNIHMVENGDRVWMFNERGELIIAQLSPKGFTEISRTKIIDPTTDQLRQRGGVCWAHPAFAGGHVFARNDNELICVSVEKSP